MYDSQSEHSAFQAYRSHKVVRAAKITVIYSSICVGVGDGGQSIVFDPHNKPIPEVGMYVICYDDGYISFSPAKAFELGYSPAA